MPRSVRERVQAHRDRRREQGGGGGERLEEVGEILLDKPAKYMCAVFGAANHFTPAEVKVGAMVLNCEHCAAIRFPGELPNICCKAGKVTTVERTILYPEHLKDLLLGDGADSKNFRDFFRQFNNANAFASMGANVEEMTGRGHYCFKVSGDIYHRSSATIDIDTALNPPNTVSSNCAKFAELYMYDTDTSVSLRMNNDANRNCNRNIMARVGEILSTVSPYAHSYKTLRDQYESEKIIARNNNDNINQVRLVFTRNLRDDQRTYNAPNNSNDVALIFTADRDGNFTESNIDFCVYPSGDRQIKRLNSVWG